VTDDGVRKYEWDAFNRLKRVWKTPSSPVLIGEYTYDAGGRRIRKVISNGGLSGSIGNGTIDFAYDGLQCVEERDGSNNPIRQYAWGVYVDECLQLRNDISGTPADYFPLQDINYRTVALVDATGAIAETYDYDPYGNTLIFNAAGTGGNWWADDATQTKSPTCDYLWTGRRYDAETEIYYFRARYYEPTLGRFLSEDPLGYVDGMNLYHGYFAPNGVDPLGLADNKCEWMFHAYDHGGPHFQRTVGGKQHRYDAKTLEPIKHGTTPPELSKTQLRKLRSSAAWRKWLKFSGGAIVGVGMTYGYDVYVAEGAEKGVVIGKKIGLCTTVRSLICGAATCDKRRVFSLQMGSGGNYEVRIMPSKGKCWAVVDEWRLKTRWDWSYNITVLRRISYWALVPVLELDKCHIPCRSAQYGCAK
jgi:RHS repeat-associated protein